MKTIMISIYKKHNENIFDTLLKTEEIRKVKPKIDLPFKVVVYEPLGKKHKYNGKYCKTQNCNDCNGEWCYEGCGKVVGEFFVDRIEAIKTDMLYSVAEKACISKDELFKYLGVVANSNFYDTTWGFAWHITAPKLYGEPKELGEFYRADMEMLIDKIESIGCGETRCEFAHNNSILGDDGFCDYGNCPKLRVTHAPQSYMRIEEDTI